MKSDMLFGEEARAALLRGADHAAHAVCGTLGPRGKNTVLSRRIGAPVVSGDGSGIAREIYLPDPYENMGAQLLREVSVKTKDAVGDGTTTAVVLAHAMMREGVRLAAAGANPVTLRAGMNQALEEAVSVIRKNARPVRGQEELAIVGALAAGDADIGALIAATMAKLPDDSLISVEESRGTQTTAEVVEGMEFDRGYLTPYMVTDQAKMQAVLADPYILLTDRKIGSILDLLPVMELVKKYRGALFVVCEDVETEPLAALVVNRMQGAFNCVCVKAPSFGDRRRDLLEDMAALTGGKVVRSERGMDMKETTLDMLGRAKKVVVSKDSTLILDGQGDRETIWERIALAQSELARAEFDFDILKLRERIGRLSGGVGVIRVGAYTEAELQEKKLRVEGAVNATRAAAREGVVAGGGTAYVAAAQALAAWAERLPADERLGAEILRGALCAPMKQLAQNAGFDASAALETVRARNDPRFGFDAVQGRARNLVEAGIVDPAAVCIAALRNAASVAAVVVTTEGVLAEIEERKA